MPKIINLEDLFEQAVEAIPYPDLEPTSIEQGELEAYDKGFVEYSVEYTFEAGKLFDDKLVAGGWVELRQDSPEDEIY